MDGVNPPKLAVWKLASCDGCQLTLLDCEDELLAVAGAVQISHFTEASSAEIEGPYDVSLVEGSVTTDRDARRIIEIREASRVLVCIGACATSGGIQALRNFADVAEFTSVVYARPDYICTLATSTPVADHVEVDFELRGCPIDRRQLFELLTALLAGRKPRIPAHSVCYECKLRGTSCVMVAHGTPCLGPVTQAGCGAICPAYGRGCYGCFGPVTAPISSASGGSRSRSRPATAGPAPSSRRNSQRQHVRLARVIGKVEPGDPGRGGERVIEGPAQRVGQRGELLAGWGPDRRR